MYRSRRNVTRRKDFVTVANELAVERFYAEADGQLPDGIDDLSIRACYLGHSALSRRGDTGKGQLEAITTRAMDMADLRATGELALTNY